MKTSTIEVGDLISTLSAAGVHRQLSTLPGVQHADVNYVAGSATVQYDEAKIALDAIRLRVIDCGYHCRGELLPKHVCDPANLTAGGDGDTHADHAGHTMPAGATGESISAAPVAEEPAKAAKDPTQVTGLTRVQAGQPARCPGKKLVKRST